MICTIIGLLVVAACIALLTLIGWAANRYLGMSKCTRLKIDVFDHFFNGIAIAASSFVCLVMLGILCVALNALGCWVKGLL